MHNIDKCQAYTGELEKFGQITWTKERAIRLPRLQGRLQHMQS